MMAENKDHQATNVCPWHSGVKAEIKSMQRALDVARQELERRLEGMNEFREQLRSQANTFVIREANDVMNKEMERRVRIIETNRSNLEGRMWVIPTIIVLIQIAIVIFKMV